VNKEQLALGIAQKTGISKAEATRFLEGFIASIEEAILAGERVTISGFGTFELTRHKGRTVVNPATKQPMDLPPQTTARFRASKVLKTVVKQSKG
jgi:DNA-binding protein HU-beta